MEDYEIRVPQPGEHYEHYKGGRYEVLAVGRLSEQRDQICVVYRSLERGHIWIRPLGMWGDYEEWTTTEPAPQGVLVTAPLKIRTHRAKRFTLCADSPPSQEAIPLSPEEAAELDRELALTLSNKAYEQQKCQHLRRNSKMTSYATVRITTTPDKDGTILWEYRVELSLCVFCAGFATGHIVDALRSDPILCAEAKAKT